MVSAADEVQSSILPIARLSEITAMRHGCGSILSSSLRMHRQVPLALGSGASDVDHKVRCIIQKVFLESTSIASAKALLVRLRACCVDMGTELSISDLGGKCLEASDYLPAWLRRALLVAQDQPEDGALLGSPDLANCVFPLTMLSAGTVHICNNLAKDLDQSLPGWKQFMEGFSCVAFLLHHAWLRNRIVGRLLVGTPHESLKSVVDKAGCYRFESW